MEQEKRDLVCSPSVLWQIYVHTKRDFVVFVLFFVCKPWLLKSDIKRGKD